MHANLEKGLKIRRALLSVSDKEGVVELAQALQSAGAELVATGNTATVLRDAGLKVTSIERLTGMPESFQGRMKTLSFPVFSGILYKRDHAKDEKDLDDLGFVPIDCVVVNFYPFESVVSKSGTTREEWIESIDIGGPSLVRAAAKNSPDVLVLTDRMHYQTVIDELSQNKRVSVKTVEKGTADAWEYVSHYDHVIAQNLGIRSKRKLRYGENPHQSAYLEIEAQSPIAWDEVLTSAEISYNNILDLSACYELASDLVTLDPQSTGVVVVKHHNPCGVSVLPKDIPGAQKQALLRAWEGDPVSAFGGVLLFTDRLEEETAAWLSERFIELVAAPGLFKDDSALLQMLSKRKNLKAISVRRIREVPHQSMISVPGGRLVQNTDRAEIEALKLVTKKKWPKDKEKLARFGIAVCRSLKSNALAIVREVPGSPQVFQLVGAGQGQPNRVDALQRLAIPRAQEVLKTLGGTLADCVLVSDAFFPFRDTVDAAHAAGIQWVVQPGGSIKDAESVAACDEHGMSMVFTGVRHFRH